MTNGYGMCSVKKKGINLENKGANNCYEYSKEREFFPEKIKNHLVGLLLSLRTWNGNRYRIQPTDQKDHLRLKTENKPKAVGTERQETSIGRELPDFAWFKCSQILSKDGLLPEVRRRSLERTWEAIKDTAASTTHFCTLLSFSLEVPPQVIQMKPSRV